MINKEDDVDFTLEDFYNMALALDVSIELTENCLENIQHDVKNQIVLAKDKKQTVKDYKNFIVSANKTLNKLDQLLDFWEIDTQNLETQTEERRFS